VDPRSESRDEADGLRVWDGRGTARLVDTAQDGPTTALLLEACEPGTPLAEALPPAEQDVVLAGMLRRLWTAPPAGSAFRPLAEMCAWWADSAEAGLPADPLTQDGLALFRSLPLDTSEPALLVTDLHGGNVLAARREPWLVVDPKPYVGDRHYDLLQHLLNQPDRLGADPLGLARRMASLLDLDADRLRLWLGARCVVESPARPELTRVARRLLR
jgi:streptomycin 6-kinase